MKHTILAAVAATALWAGASGATTFSGFVETGPIYFDELTVLNYAPGFGVSVVDAGTSNLRLYIQLGADLDNGAFDVLDGASGILIAAGLLRDTMLSEDNGTLDDTFSMLFGLTAGATSHAIATFTGDLDRLGTTSFLTDGVFTLGRMRIVGASEVPTGVIPLPATLPLVLAGLGGFAFMARRKR